MPLAPDIIKITITIANFSSIKDMIVGPKQIDPYFSCLKSG